MRMFLGRLSICYVITKFNFPKFQSEWSTRKGLSSSETSLGKIAWKGNSEHRTFAGRIQIKTHQAALWKVRPSLLLPENNCMLIIMSKHSLDLTLCSWKTDERRTFSGGWELSEIFLQRKARTIWQVKLLSHYGFSDMGVGSECVNSIFKKIIQLHFPPPLRITTSSFSSPIIICLIRIWPSLGQNWIQRYY